MVYSIELPRRGDCNEYSQELFYGEQLKNMYATIIINVSLHSH